ncbi:MAG: hypothetical protein JXK07_13270 [Spirochaetes bacterium]|nr:hypothetical protein [Spirochaetota bacterium]MBN2769771.1 hypothetical protein [Spirochaetota bacterium]HRX14802.1 hypothetical protein [Spirochaetota bacterium]
MSKGLVVEKTDKHGNIDTIVLSDVKQSLLAGKFVILPVDGIYCTASILSEKNYFKLSDQGFTDIFVMIKDFSDLERYSRIEKKDYDFLHRLWPDDVYVKLHSTFEESFDTDFFYYIPKTGYLNTLLNQVDQPIMYSFKNNRKSKPYYSITDLKRAYSRVADRMLIINQYCKEHLSPTFIDIRNKRIQIVSPGRVDDEDIKSLYYL